MLFAVPTSIHWAYTYSDVLAGLFLPSTSHLLCRFWNTTTAGDSNVVIAEWEHYGSIRCLSPALTSHELLNELIDTDPQMGG